MATMSLIDFAQLIMEDMIHTMHSNRNMTKIPFIRFTKMIIEYLIGETPEFKSRLLDLNEPVHSQKMDFTIKFIKTTLYSTKKQGAKLFDHLLDDKITNTATYRRYLSAFNSNTVGYGDDDTSKTSKPATRSQKPTKAGSTTSTTSTTRKKAPAKAPKGKLIAKPSRLHDEPTPSPSEQSAADEETETDSGGETVYREVVEDDDELMKITKQQSLQSIAEDEERRRRKRGVTISEINAEFGEDDEEEEPAEKLVDKRKVKSVVVDNRAELKEEAKRLRLATLISRSEHQPPPPSVLQTEDEGGPSSTQHDTVNQPGNVESLTAATIPPSDTVNQPGTKDGKDDATDTLMEEQPQQQNDDFNPFITPKDLSDAAKK